ncbi:hypothetical protein PR002_g30283 [Phytophthora rubi]|uniref:Uncharacterized protein n=1 Tax=Phytophthora rubi TaxID=129364 RepID=A0A6A3GTB7_9STRA|nr:hypothetical protein PR002_g30283 [Phytophthora rubi]
MVTISTQYNEFVALLVDGQLADPMFVGARRGDSFCLLI